jgi:hypothetical protein
VPQLSSFPVVSLLFASAFFHSGLEGGYELQFVYEEDVAVWRISTCALTAFCNNTSPRHLSNKSKGSHYSAGTSTSRVLVGPDSTTRLDGLLRYSTLDQASPRKRKIILSTLL